MSHGFCMLFLDKANQTWQACMGVIKGCDDPDFDTYRDWVEEHVQKAKSAILACGLDYLNTTNGVDKSYRTEVERCESKWYDRQGKSPLGAVCHWGVNIATQHEVPLGNFSECISNQDVCATESTVLPLWAVGLLCGVPLVLVCYLAARKVSAQKGVQQQDSLVSDPDHDMPLLNR